MRVARPGEAAYLDLPGGAIDPGEDAQAALVREFGEETGLIVRPGALIASGAQFMRKTDGQAVNTLCRVFEATLMGESPTLKIEADHELEWREPFTLMRLLRHEAHAWAVLAWLRGWPAGRSDL